MSADYDSPWKEALDRWFRPFLAFFFPPAHADIDWSRGYETLDTELQQVVRDAELGRRYADKLVKVWLRDGSERWLLVHVEVQGRREEGFARRVFVYNYRIFDRYNAEVVSLVVLADDDANWLPRGFRYGRWGAETGNRFEPVKLLHYAGREVELEADANPFARVVLAHLKALETRQDSASRHAWKLRLVRGLYEGGFGAEDVRELFRLIDWMMELPPALENLFWREMERLEEERRMPYVTSVERIGMERGRKGAQLESIEDLLRDKFGEAGLALMPEIKLLDDAEKYRAIIRAIGGADRPEDLRKLWA
jgi:hypothetical protein